MTNLRKAAEMALAALEWSWGGEPLGTKEFEAITALRQALAQPEQEPVAWTTKGQIAAMDAGFQHYIQGRVPRFVAPTENDVPLYTAPPKREWVGLTDKERIKCYETTGNYQTLRPQDSFAVLSLASAIETKLKEKNT